MKKTRDSNLELLRIICMFFLVMHHFTVHGGSIGMEGMSANRIISLIILPLGKICFNTFVAMSTWFLVKSDFRTARFLKIWFQVLFYNIAFVAATKIMGGAYSETISWKNWVGACFPMLGNSHGYAATYMAFYLTTPFLKIVADKINKAQLIITIVFLSATQLLPLLFGVVLGYTQPFASEILLFVLCYFISLFLQRYPMKAQDNKWILALIFLVGWLFTAFCRIWNVNHPEKWFVGFWANYVTGSEFSYTNIIAGYALFLLFRQLRISNSKIINAVATTTFGILLIHDHNYFRPVLWKVIFKTDQWYYISTASFVFQMVAITIIIMAVCMVIDFLRQYVIEKPLMQSEWVGKICAKADMFMRDTCFDTDKDQSNDNHTTNPIRLTNKNRYMVEFNHRPVLLFSVGTLIATALYWAMMIVTRSSNIDAYFVTDHTNTGMDYFNMLSNLDHGDPWYDNANYPAMVFLFFKFMLHMVPLDNMGDGFYLRENMIAQLGYILFLFICLIIIWETIRYMTRSGGFSGTLFGTALIFSGPMFFLMERGNMLLAVLAFSLLFLAFYDDEWIGMRIFAYASLSMAAAIKIYPAVLGLLVLGKKRYKETILLVIMGAVFFMAPFFVFDGIESLKKMIAGISYAAALQTDGTGFGCNFSMNNLVQMAGAVLGKYIKSVPGWVSVASAVLCLIMFLFCKQEWQKLYALVLLCIWFPGFSYTYTLVLLFLPIVSYFFRTESSQKGYFRFVYPFVFMLLVIPYGLPMVETINMVLQTEYVKYPVSWGMVIINCVLVLLACMILIEAIMDCKNKKEIGGKAL